jgi:hypothetical protein
MTAKKQRIQDVIEVINTTSIEPETEVIEQLANKKIMQLCRFQYPVFHFIFNAQYHVCTNT